LLSRRPRNILKFPARIFKIVYESVHIFCLPRHSFSEGGEDPIYNQLLDIFKKEGVEPIEALGKGFDPLYHEALEQVEVPQKEKDGTVLEEMQKGYTIYNRVLRPAKVKIGIYKNI